MTNTEGHTHRRLLINTPTGTSGMNISGQATKENGSYEFVLADGSSITVSKTTEWIAGPPEVIKPLEP